MKNITTIGSVPLWAWVLVGWMAAGAATAVWQRGGLERAVGDVDAVVESVDIDWDLDSMSARELRALPGIGQKRAVDLVEARWQHDPAKGDFDIESVDGIGQKTAESVQQFVGERRMTPPPPRSGRTPAKGPKNSALLRRPVTPMPLGDRNGGISPHSNVRMIPPPILRPR